MLNGVQQEFKNPYRPGAGHMPPHLAGRQDEHREFERVLGQDTILENVILTGLRGVGKTVLLETFKPLAISRGWLWVGTDLSESTSVSEERLALRLLTDLAVVTSALVTDVEIDQEPGFATPQTTVVRRLDFTALGSMFNGTPGLVSDKLKAVLEAVWARVQLEGKRGVVFAYDEAQNLADHPDEGEFPLSLLLDVFQSIQRKGVPFMLVLTGLPTLFPKLVEARTFAERMFRVMQLNKLDRPDSEEAILLPLDVADCPVRFDDDSVGTICEQSGGYPYFIQFICREVFDVFIQQIGEGKTPEVPVEAITRKLDSDFFAGRWSRATDRQRDILMVVALLHKADGEFTVQEVVDTAPAILGRKVSNSRVNQILASLGVAGLIYKNRYGRYSLAVPLLDRFIIRQASAT